VALADLGLFPHTQDQVSGIASGINKGEARVRVGYTRGVGIEMREIPMLGRGSSSSRWPPAVITNGGSGGDWNAGRASLKLAVGLQRESGMVNLPIAVLSIFDARSSCAQSAGIVFRMATFAQWDGYTRGRESGDAKDA
jgi:hypothetical protein